MARTERRSLADLYPGSEYDRQSGIFWHRDVMCRPGCFCKQPEKRMTKRRERYGARRQIAQQLRDA